jgi:hypothetical protein
MKKKIFFIGMVVIALVLTGGTFAYGYTSSSMTLPATLSDTAWATYQVAADQPDWASVLPEGDTNSEVLVPINDGDEISLPTVFPSSTDSLAVDTLATTDTSTAVLDTTNTTAQAADIGILCIDTHWDKVDDQPADEAASYVSSRGSSTWKRDLYQLSAFSGDGGTGTISSVTVFIRYAAGGNYSVSARAEIEANGQVFESDIQTANDANFVTYAWQHDVNPATGAAWTTEDISTLQAGVALKGNKSTKPAVCTQVYIQVNYETPGIALGEIPQGFLYTVNPDTNYMGDLSVKVYITNTADLSKAYQYLNLKINVSGSVEAGNTPDYKVLSLENGVVEFSILGGSSMQYIVSVTGGGYSLVSDDPAEWGVGYTVTPEFYCEITQR